jgi:hypothetical protein
MTAVVAGLSYGVHWALNFQNAQLNDVRDVLADYPEIDRVWLGTNEDVQTEVEQVYFTIKGQPHVTFHSGGIDTVSKHEFRKRLVRALKQKRPVTRPEYVREYTFQ